MTLLYYIRYIMYLTSTEENTAVFYLRYSSRLDGLAYDEILTVLVLVMVGNVSGIIYGPFDLNFCYNSFLHVRLA